MQQRFHTRSISVRDFEQWNERGELELAPKFQRRNVWKPKARSYLMDTILRGKPIPKLYMRQDINPKTRKTIREIVDGQQRLRTVLEFLKDAFPINKSHSDRFGGDYYSDLDEGTQGDILKYEFVVDLLEDMPDPEVYDLFARINTYSEKLKDQELRNAKWFGDFKSSAYSLSKQTVTFFKEHRIFSDSQILRMQEAEFLSELLIAVEEGIREKTKSVIDAAYKKYDDKLPNRSRHEGRIVAVFDLMGNILGDHLRDSRLKGGKLFYPLFCAMYHMQYGLPKLSTPRKPIKTSSYPRIRIILEGIHELVEEWEAARKKHKDLELTADQRRFTAAYAEHWVHAANRTTLTQFICKRVMAG